VEKVLPGGLVPVGVREEVEKVYGWVNIVQILCAHVCK
jgi:hypothetical protein